MMMYIQDYDELTPSVYQIGNYLTDATTLIQPYLKNKQALFCPDRDESVCGASDGTADVYVRDKPCLGYGYNWGPTQNYYSGRSSGGLLDTYESAGPGAGVRALGKAMSDMVAPASLFAFGDTHDAPWYTITLDTSLATFKGKRNSQLQHGGRYNMMFMDGHAKAIRWRGGYAPLGYGGRIALPRDPSQYGYWCANPDTTVVTNVGTMPCKDVAAAYAATVTQWFPD